MVYAYGSGPYAARLVGSSPTLGTNAGYASCDPIYRNSHITARGFFLVEESRNPRIRFFVCTNKHNRIIRAFALSLSEAWEKSGAT